MDFIVALPTTRNGNDAALNMTDKFPKQVADWGFPAVIISDRDPKFIQGLWKAIFLLLNVDLIYTTAYHPQADGQSERTNQTVEISLRHWCAQQGSTDENEAVSTWDEALPFIQATLNSSVNASTSYSPHQLMYGVTLKQPMDMMRQAMATEQDFSSRLDAERSIAYAAMAMKHYYDKTHVRKWFEPGDHVYWYAKL